MAADCPNTALSRLTAGGPWHLLQSPADMHALILLFVNAADGGEPDTTGTICGTCPAPTTAPRKGKPDAMLEACRAAGAAAAGTAEPNVELAYIRTAAATALESTDVFTLRWFTFTVMYLSDEIVTMLSCAAPAPVVDRFLAPFKANMANHVFGTSVSKNKSKSKAPRPPAPEHVISTPLEIVATFMIHLQASYFAAPP